MVLQCLRSLLRRSLETATKDNMTSVAFPAIGADKLGYPNSTVAHVMFDEVLSFSAGVGSSSSLRNVYFVIYEKDPKTLAVRSPVDHLLLQM